MNEDQPVVSVITAAYNSEKFIAQAIQSVLEQTYQNFEFLIVNDASTDRTCEIIQSFNDKRIRLFNNSKNKERSYSRNLAIEQAKGEYIAILDADDICFSDRLDKQMNYLKTHSDISVLGGNYIKIDDSGNEVGRLTDFPINHNQIVWLNCFGSPIAHSTAVVKTETMRKVGGYDINWPPVEDADLWIRLANTGARFSNLVDPLVKYRTSQAQIHRFISNSGKSRERRRLFIEEITNLNVTEDMYNLLFLVQRPNSSVTIANHQLVSVMDILFRLYNSLLHGNYFIQDDLDLIKNDLIAGIGKLAMHNETLRNNMFQSFIENKSRHDLANQYWLTDEFSFIQRWGGFMLFEPRRFHSILIQKINKFVKELFV